jgi:predicted dehydrogenase
MENNRIGRRDLLKSLAALPLVGYILYGAFRKSRKESLKKNSILRELGINHHHQPKSENVTDLSQSFGGELVRIGIIGTGSRGQFLMKGLGYAHPDWIDNNFEDSSKTVPNAKLKTYLDQEDINVVVTAVCDVFDERLQHAYEIATTRVRPKAVKKQELEVKAYKDYRRLLEDPNVDAVIVATPDHWHAQISWEAAEAGKHVYSEKGPTRTVEEAYKLHERIKSAGVVYQLGHQNRQQNSYQKARDLIKAGKIGKVSVAETFTNRNTPWGAWIRHEGKPGNPRTIDWDMWLGPSPKKQFSLDRYYNWSKYWDYSTGLGGQLFSHEFDGINQIMQMGIPESVTASGGTYYFKDGRETPDVFQLSFDYPEKGFVLLYNATLMNSQFRQKSFLGTDGFMEVGNSLQINVDSNSTRYADLLKKGVVQGGDIIFSYQPGDSDVDAVTTPTEQYYASRGLIYTYRGGKRYDLAFLHMVEWLNAIRTNGITSCNIDQAFEEAITIQMAVKAYREKRVTKWDAEKRKIV